MENNYIHIPNLTPFATLPADRALSIIHTSTTVSRLNRLDVRSAGGNANETGGGTSNAEPTAGQQQQQPPHQQPSASPLELLTSLVDLNVARNKFDEQGVGHSLGVFTKTGFPRLSILDVRGNNLPAEEETRELLRISTVGGGVRPLA